MRGGGVWGYGIWHLSISDEVLCTAGCFRRLAGFRWLPLASAGFCFGEFYEFACLTNTEAINITICTCCTKNITALAGIK